MSQEGGAQDEPPEQKPARIGRLPPAEAKPYNPVRAREKLRGALALALVGLLTVTVIGAGLIVAAHWATSGDVRDLLDPILAAEVALTGSAVGFYFGGRDRF